MNFSSDDLWELFESNDSQKVKNYGGVSAIAKSLNSDPIQGLNQKDVASNLTKFGTNDIPDRPIRSFFDMLKEALSDQTLIILIICAIVSLVLEIFFAPPEEKSTAWIDGTAILMAVAIVSIVQAYSNHKQEIQFSAVNRIKSIFNIAVIRNGQLQHIKNTELVVGDIIQVEQGDRIPADCLLLQSVENIRVDQSAATGESEAVFKSENDPFLISNTHLTEGRATLLVVCVGVKSHHGRIFTLLNESERLQTPLQEKLEVLAAKIGGMGVFVASLTFIVLVCEWIYRCSKLSWKWAYLREPLSYFIVAITIIACAVPEGLPLAVTISLAYSMTKMMTDNNFVRHLSACETMGSATVICTDKTGTLTQNQMNVEEAIIGQNIIEVDVLRNENDFIHLLKQCSAINTHAVISNGDEIGSQTECALVRFVSFLRGDVLSLRKKAKIEKCFDFDRTRKKMSTVERKTDDTFLVHVKGAPDMIINNCSKLYLDSSTIVDMNEEHMNILLQKIDEECAKSYRTLAIAMKHVSQCPSTPEEAECDLTLLCVLCIRDSLRKNTVKSIQNCQKAGIRVIMVTGDHMITAEAIAKECNILTSDKIAITGATLRSMNEEELKDNLPLISVVARSTPLDKHLLVTSLQKMGEVVSVTGDGTNDVAALMAADVGLSMGKCGTELAKEASDIVVLDDDFRSIVRAVVWGRTIFNNIQRFLQFQLTANVSTLFISFISAVFLSETPFKAVQLLWVNLIMDSLGALSLSTGNPHENLLEHKPQNKDTPLITPFMIMNISGQAILQIILIGQILLFPGDLERYSQYHYTYLFNVFVLSQAFNLLNARATEPGDDIFLGVFDTPIFFGIMFGIIGVQWILVQIAGQFFSCTPLLPHEWISSLLMASLSLPVGWIIRHIGPKKTMFGKGRREDVQPLLKN
ncbi:calcium-translocating P-type ATPase, PMCA-type family protein [Tritrichomonas foetus]|uniref:Calcium-transporting ATPase n=1 Tax=Tritrichomonas foetus TaxID=1144522 RepID=A0A1J4KF50_9EUKA|nr:calcium-translocating P-type ATPase, PMCA-type family protein [Tritrichomonas foetus]|eukprot:OHT10071.1 calcium-translocating P-type ATPase, PMCA-type family protein [Tritrichomonas foetus]